MHSSIGTKLTSHRKVPLLQAILLLLGRAGAVVADRYYRVFAMWSKFRIWTTESLIHAIGLDGQR